ncbi:MAG: hypothetical protein ACQETQ_00795 [Spirochaetota bacterium]
MILLSYYSVTTFSNIYIIGCEEHSKAVIVDPGRFEAPLLEFIESHELTPTHALITRPESDYARGIRTLRRIYDVEILCAVPHIGELGTTVIEDGYILRVGNMEIRTIAITAHSQDALAFAVDHLVFPGPILSAGDIGVEHSGYPYVLSGEMIRDRLLGLPPSTLILPREGPPSTVGLERTTNPALSAVLGQ